MSSIESKPLGAVQNRGSLKSAAFLWSQFAPYHVDRCEAAADALAGRYEVIACEIASASQTYLWEPSGEVAGARKITLFPGDSVDAIGGAKRTWRCFMALRKAHIVFVGVSYADPDIIALSILLRLFGCRVVMMTESKFDDKDRHVFLETFKAIGLWVYSAAMVGGYRQLSYARFLGFRRRPIEIGYDTVNLGRVRALADHGGPALPFEDRPFLFVGRFVAKKNIVNLIHAYALYRQSATGRLRRLVLAGSGELEASIRAAVARHDISEHVEFTGFVQAPDVAARLRNAVALILPSLEEQWGLVVNEALAFALPVIVSDNVGARDLLVRNNHNGYIVHSSDVDGLARAMLDVGDTAEQWGRLSAASARLASAGDTARFGAAVSALAARLVGV